MLFCDVLTSGIKEKLMLVAIVAMFQWWLNVRFVSYSQYFRNWFIV